MANTNTTTVRVTKAQKYNAIIALLEGKEPIVIPGTDEKAGVTLDANYLCDFCHNELALLGKKNSGDKKPTATQEANARYRELIMEYLAVQDAPKTCGEIGDNIPELSDFRSQKIAALLKKLVDNGQVNKTVGKKGQSLFAIAWENPRAGYPLPAHTEKGWLLSQKTRNSLPA